MTTIDGMNLEFSWKSIIHDNILVGSLAAQILELHRYLGESLRYRKAHVSYMFAMAASA